jgi:hypothetical protein
MRTSAHECAVRAHSRTTVKLVIGPRDPSAGRTTIPALYIPV